MAVFHEPSLSKFLVFNQNDTFSFLDRTFETNIIKPYISLTWMKDKNVYCFMIQIARAMGEVMRWKQRYKPTYHTYRQADSSFYYKDLQSDLIDHVNIIKFDYLKHVMAMLWNAINTPIGPIVYFKYQKDLKHKQLHSIIV
eukprot:835301_1